ncbi:uncharacterized protein [Elaeis guineensis]|uniref:uncharacterized protein isoform X4 n=1 Tax=Elaeis guineensis var. tenera TaxID=51953 RepID=UPI003C6D62F0
MKDQREQPTSAIRRLAAAITFDNFMKNESWSSIAANGLKGLQIVTADGRLENLVDPFPGFKISANGNLTKNLFACSNQPYDNFCNSNDAARTAEYPTAACTL